MNGSFEPTSKIPVSELEQMLLDPDVPDSALRPYLMIDDSGGNAYQPRVRVSPSRVEGPGPAEGIRAQAAFFLSSLNGVALAALAKISAQDRGMVGPTDRLGGRFMVPVPIPAR